MSVRLAEELWQMRQPKVMVVGDHIWDIDYHGTQERFAQEASGLPVFNKIERSEERPGGAGAVSVMTHGLGGKVVSFAALASRKERYYIDGRLVFRVDQDELPHSGDTDEVADWVTQTLPTVDAVLVADYGKGICVPKVLRAAIDGAQHYSKPCLVDPARGRHWSDYEGCTAIKCNTMEFDAAFEHNWDSYRWWQPITESVVITQGSSGMERIERDGSGRSYPARPRDAVCVLGCGDMVLASLGVCLAGGMGWNDACTVANAAAGLKVERRGAVPVSRAEVCLDLCHGTKVIPASLLPAVRAVADKRKQKVVWTNGALDWLHPGHLHCLREAKKQGDILVVGINDDASVRRLKGASRPLVPLEHRTAMLAALECVDWVVPFGSEDELVAAIEAARVDVLVKGADYLETDVVGAAGVLARGGRVHLVPVLTGYSTTALAARRLP